MELMPKEIREKFEKQGDTGEKSADEIKIIAKYFNPVGAGTWFCYEFDGDDILQCFANLGNDDCAETGTVRLSDLERMGLPLGLGI